MWNHLPENQSNQDRLTLKLPSHGSRAKEVMKILLLPFAWCKSNTTREEATENT